VFSALNSGLTLRHSDHSDESRVITRLTD